MVIERTGSWLSWFLRALLVLFFLLMEVRLIKLQLIEGKYYRAISENNRIKRLTLPAPRGAILARGGEILASDRGGKRYYSLGAMAGHLTGYLSEIAGDEVGRVNPDCIHKGVGSLGGLTGRTGLEETYNCSLSGIDGEELIEVDTKGGKIRDLGERKPQAGENLKTNIDFNLQKVVSSAMGEKKGAAIVTDARGEVLAFYSAPSFDPNNFIAGVGVEKYFSDPQKPLFNRAISGLYHPGSVFKPLIALAGLSEGTIDRNYFYNDTGFIEVSTLYGKFIYNNWYFTQYGKVEGKINIIQALGRSTDTFFYTLGESLGVDKIVAWAAKVGLNRRVNIDLPSGVSGFVPDPTWKEKVKKEKWFLGNTYHLAIGQGDLALSPAHIQELILVLASKGKLCDLKIVGETQCVDLNLKDEALTTITEGMVKACSSGGTGVPFFDFNEQSDKKVACKTGTAETGDNKTSHAWFTLFAPSDEPEIVVTVLVEKGGEGSTVAGPIARKIVDAFFKK